MTGVPRQLARIGWKGELFEVRLDGAKDLAELHLQAPDRFKTRLGNAMSSVRSIPLPKLSRPSGTSGSRRRPGAALAAARRLLVDSLAAGEWRSHDWLAREARSLSEK